MPSSFSDYLDLVRQQSESSLAAFGLNAIIFVRATVFTSGSHGTKQILFSCVWVECHHLCQSYCLYIRFTWYSKQGSDLLASEKIHMGSREPKIHPVLPNHVSEPVTNSHYPTLLAASSQAQIQHKMRGCSYTPSTNTQTRPMWRNSSRVCQ